MEFEVKEESLNVFINDNVLLPTQSILNPGGPVDLFNQPYILIKSGNIPEDKTVLSFHINESTTKTNSPVNTIKRYVRGPYDDIHDKWTLQK